MTSEREKFSELLETAVGQHRSGRLVDAEQAYQMIIEHCPDHGDALELLSIVAYQRGNLDLAIDLRNKAVKINATYPPFHNNLGNALQTSGKLEEAIASYKRALALNPNYSEAHKNLGDALQTLGKLEEAIASYERTLALNPNYSEAHKNLGDVLLKLERIDESINFYEQALAINSEYIGAANNLGLAFLCKEWYEHAQKVFHQSFFKRYSLPQEKLAKFDPTNLMETGKDSKTLNTSRIQLIDRIEQLIYLMEKKLIDSSFQNLVDRYHCLLNELNSQVNPVPYTPLTQQQAELFAGYYDRIIYYTDAPHVSGSAVNEGLDWKSIEKSYQASSVVYFDDFLTPDTLEGLRKFCLESTVFFRHSEAGFVASYMHEGFNCSLLYQIIAELKRNLPSVLGGLSLNNMWIYRYASRGNGVKTHTDDASVTINFWITPDEANLNLNSGSGLVVYDQKQPFDWDWLKYNVQKDDPHIQAQINAFLETAHSLNIPYRCNRAVIFHSKLFHRSDPFHFRDSFESRRMNVTMLFGKIGKESASLK